MQDVVQRVGHTCYSFQRGIAFAAVVVDLEQPVISGVFDDQLDCGAGVSLGVVDCGPA
jgi:hypothetical protein